MYFIEANKKSIHSYKFLSVGRTYMHLLVALKYDKIFKNEIIKHVLNVLLEWYLQEINIILYVYCIHILFILDFNMLNFTIHQMLT